MAYTTLHDRLRGPILKDLQKELKIANPHATPKLDKVTVNVGINKSKMDSKETREYIEKMLMRITGQKPVFTRARVAISNFKTRQGMIVGVKVNLRGKKMEEFLDRLISYSIPRIRDFRGLPKKLDGKGNYSIGLNDHSIFPEVPAPDVGQIFNMQIVISTTAKDDTEGMALMKAIGMPFKRNEVQDAKDAKAAKDAEAKKGNDPVANDDAPKDTVSTEKTEE